MTRLARIFKDYLEAGALHGLVSIQAVLDDGRTFLTKNGDVLAVLATDGVDPDCLDLAQLDHVARRCEGAVRLFDEQFDIYQYVFKRSHAAIPHRTYTHPIVQQLVDKRLEYLKERSAYLFSVETYFVIVYTGWRPDEDWRTRISGFITDPKAALHQAVSTEKRQAHLDAELDRARRLLSDKVDSFVAQLRDVVPFAVLDKQHAFRFLRRLLNYTPYKADAVRLKHDDFVDFQACDTALEVHRDHLQLGDDFVQVLTLKEPPAHTFAHMWRGLQEIRCDCIIASEWRRASNARVRRMIQSMRRYFHNTKSSMANYLTTSAETAPKDMLIDDSAVAMIGQLGTCLEELEVHGRYFGQFSMTIALFGPDRAAVRGAVAEFVKVFAAHDAQVVEERYNLLNAWVALLPGNQAYNVRRLWLTNTNYADVSFVFGPRTGHPENRHLKAEYLAVLETEVGTPYFLNLHYQDTAHSLVVGATGSGKSFFLNFLVSCLLKQNPLTFIFDLGGGYVNLTRLFQGAYASIGSETRQVQINPFCLPPTPKNRQFLVSFCRVLIESGGYTMNAADERDLTEQIENVYSVETDQRRLLTLANIVNRNLRAYLHKWTQAGSHGRWFDNVTDNVTFARLQAFDFEGMSNYPDVLEALLFYILHRATALIYDAEFAATFKVFILDEAWRFFRHPAIKLYIIEALKTWRKKNAAMILATQSLDDLPSDLLSVVVESCPTKLFLANAGMDRAAYREIFHLNETEADRIAALIPKQQILIKQPDLAKVVNLKVDPETYRLFTQNASDSVARRDESQRYALDGGSNILARSNPT